MKRPTESTPDALAPNYWTILGRSWRLRCPWCGRGKQFDGWFRMRPACDQCGYRFQREGGYYLGSIYVNYGLTAILVTAGFFVGFLALGINAEVLLAVLTVFCIAFPLWFFRYARSLWLGFDTFWDPGEGLMPNERAHRHDRDHKTSQRE